MMGMNPSNEAGGLPVPGSGQAAGSTPNDQNFPPPPAPAAPGIVPPSGQDAAAANVPSMTLPLPPNPGQNPVPKATQSDVQATTQAATPPVVDDGDLIEKEWVNKAKQIVEKNRNDPYKQSEELTVFRADYMKKRYNKNIKLDK
jgi:hypothetical protein